MSLRHTLAGVAILAVAIVASACSPGSTGQTTSGGASHDPGEVASAVSAFVAAMQSGDGGTACGYLQDDEKQLFVDNATTIAAFSAAATSCEAVVAAFPAVAGARADDLDGSLQDLSLVEDVAAGSWVYRTGDRARPAHAWPGRLAVQLPRQRLPERPATHRRVIDRPLRLDAAHRHRRRLAVTP